MEASAVVLILTSSTSVATLLALAMAVAPVPLSPISAPALENLSDLGAPIGCSDPETLWDLLAADERHDVAQRTKLMHSRCRSFDGVHYRREQQRNGVSKLRLFPDVDNWSTSCVVYTLDEMVEPTLELTEIDVAYGAAGRVEPQRHEGHEEEHEE